MLYDFSEGQVLSSRLIAARACSIKDVAEWNDASGGYNMTVLCDSPEHAAIVSDGVMHVLYDGQYVYAEEDDGCGFCEDFFGEIFPADLDNETQRFLAVNGYPMNIGGIFFSPEDERYVPLRLFSADIPCDRFCFRLTGTDDSTLFSGNAAFVSVVVRPEQVFAMQYYIERYEIDPDKCYVAFTDIMARSRVARACNDLVLQRDALKIITEFFEGTGWDVPLVPLPSVKDMQAAIPYCTNNSFAMHYGVSLRTLENWRKDPSSCPRYQRRRLLRAILNEYEYLNYTYLVDAGKLVCHGIREVI